MCELQVLDDTPTKYAKLDPRQSHGSAYGMVAAKRGYLRPVGEWNFQEVTVKGSTIKVELNGTVILDADLSQVTEFMGGNGPTRARTGPRATSASPATTTRSSSATSRSSRSTDGFPASRDARCGVPGGRRPTRSRRGTGSGPRRKDASHGLARLRTRYSPGGIPSARLNATLMYST